MKLSYYIAGAILLGGFLASQTASAALPARTMKKATGNYKTLAVLSEGVDSYIPGFSTFALAVARRESNGNNLALGEHDSKAACAGYERNRDSLFANNPYSPAYFCAGSGGWFGLMPSTALAAPGFENMDPRLIFDPIASVILFADYVRRVRNSMQALPADQRNWLAVRRFMAGNTVGLDWREEKILSSDDDGIPRARKVRERFQKDLAAWGIPSSFMYKPVRINSWPGAKPLYLRYLDGAS